MKKYSDCLKAPLWLVGLLGSQLLKSIEIIHCGSSEYQSALDVKKFNTLL